MAICPRRSAWIRSARSSRRRRSTGMRPSGWACRRADQAGVSQCVRQRRRGCGRDADGLGEPVRRSVRHHRPAVRTSPCRHWTGYPRRCPAQRPRADLPATTRRIAAPRTGSGTVLDGTRCCATTATGSPWSPDGRDRACWRGPLRSRRHAWPGSRGAPDDETALRVPGAQPPRRPGSGSPARVIRLVLRVAARRRQGGQCTGTGLRLRG